MDGQVSGLGTVHPLLTLSFVSTWILPLHVVSSTLKRKSSSSVMDGLQRRRSQYPCMDIITVSCEGAVKLLKNLKPHKAAGPDDIPLMLAKEAADEIAPAITLLFKVSLNQGNTPST